MVAVDRLGRRFLLSRPPSQSPRPHSVRRLSSATAAAEEADVAIAWVAPRGAGWRSRPRRLLRATALLDSHHGSAAPMASWDDKPRPGHTGWGSCRREQGGTASTSVAAIAQSTLDRAFAAVVAALEAVEKARAFPEGKATKQKEAADSRKRKLMARDGLRRALAAAEAVDLDEPSVEDLQERHDQSKRDEERVRKALEAKRGGGAASAAAFALTDGVCHNAASDSDAWEHLANEAAPKVAEEFRLYYSTQGQVDDTAKRQEVLEAIVARIYRAQASVAAGGYVPAGGRRGGDDDVGGGTVPLTGRPGGDT